ncbi:MAG TPA: Hsp70 family protein [Pyrinomonadaceae bacterium]|jgi:molecular chaperone DnaK
MTRLTIDFGIDLGTTNSSIAIFQGGNIEVIKNNANAEFTPSAVWLDKKGQWFVGHRARANLEIDPDNTAAEFKLQMGTDAEKTFARNGQRMRPEQLSAAVLKELKDSVKMRMGEDISAAVITVPAAFDTPQTEATKKAARLAGIEHCVLLQEPSAAALAYGFQRDSDKVFWLVYDIGGGTFDAAIVQLRDEGIDVVDHAGDNHLGGKLFDWAIIEQILVPKVVKEFKVTDFHRGNVKWRAAFARLKEYAEQAKIFLSNDRSVSIEVPNLFLGCEDFRGEGGEFEFELTRGELESLVEPSVERSFNICKRLLEKNRMVAGNIEKVLLVGGPTLMPYLRERLPDARLGLGIPLDHTKDPLTVVARGAALFAGSQRSEEKTRQPTEAGKYSVSLEYSPMGADPEPPVGGRVETVGAVDFTGFTVEISEEAARPPWQSGKIPLSAGGTFITSVWAEVKGLHTYKLELKDKAGTRQTVEPESFTYYREKDPPNPPLQHAFGVALVNNEMLLFLEKNTPLPARKLAVLESAIPLQKGQTGQLLVIPVVQGDKQRADRNLIIGTLTFSAEDIKRDVPMGSEIEVTIAVDRSNLVTASAYIPLLDEEIEVVINYEDYGKKAQQTDQLREELEREKSRLGAAKLKAYTTGDEKALEAARRIEREQMVAEVENALAAAGADRAEADKCYHRLLDLRSAIDELQDAVEWPVLVKEAEDRIAFERTVVHNLALNATPDEKILFATLEAEAREAIASREPELLRRIIRKLYDLGSRIQGRHPDTWVNWLNYANSRKHEMSDQNAADAFIIQARRALAADDFEALKAAVRHLWRLLPPATDTRTGGDEEGGIRSDVRKKTF